VQRPQTSGEWQEGISREKNRRTFWAVCLTAGGLPGWKATGRPAKSQPSHRQETTPDAIRKHPRNPLAHPRKEAGC